MRFLIGNESEKKVLGALCFCVQLFTETVLEGAEGLRGWWVGVGGGGA